MGAEGGCRHSAAPHPCRLNQQQLLELRAQVEDLQKALQEQGGKTEDVSAHLLPSCPPLLPPPPARNPSLSPPCCTISSAVDCKYRGPRVAAPALTPGRSWELDPHSPSACSLSQSALLKRKLEEHL